ncbi:3-hydroxyacyl-[acyl-carrier-protein] dehydratase [Roseimicrobium gellanilyticum]|uniref:3-hydroxyacyl-[acyl-carrier-protein] dehydratase n=2 Tax=Roseimicrobium gellanilyticum TaxID=748857 RepID=A0A366H1C5_9BACT|nr:3-hydroxyacyl-[acyl-carrier-protein] dehydratase [Roseimicrobium gellanilyticum]
MEPPPTAPNPLDSLPHGPEFRFVDAIVELEPGRRAVGTYLLKGSEDFLRGHFPAQPILPAVIMVEAIAQVAGVALQSDSQIPAMPDLRLTAIRNVKILGTAVPSETLQIEATIQGRMGNLVQAAGSVRVGDRLIAEGQVTMSGGSKEPVLAPTA